MTAEFNITIPGTEILKRLADLETRVLDLANERAIDKVLVNAHTDNIAGLIDRMDRLTDFVNGKPARTPEWPNVKPVQTTVAPPYASTSRVERIAEDFSALRDQVAVLDDIVHGRIRPADVPDQQAHIESLAAYIQRLETDLGERLTAIDRARARGDDGQHDLVTRTANSIYAEIKRLEQRISDCELAVGTDKLDGAPTPNYPANDPQKPVDTLWHSYDAETEYMLRPQGDVRVVVLMRGSNEIVGASCARDLDWNDVGYATIVAWRYAKEGE